MTLLFPSSESPRDQLQSRLMALVAIFMVSFSLVLSLSPAVRLRTWEVDYLWQHWVGLFIWLAGYSFLHRQVNRYLPDCDPFLLPLLAFLSGWGLLTIWRVSPVFGARQSIWLALCLAGFWGGLQLKGILPFLQRYKYLWLTSGLLLTAATFIFGVYPGGLGPDLWLGCCGIYIQPSEPLKLLLIAYLAAYLVEKLPGHFTLVQILTPTILLTGLALLILTAQRDLGTATIFLAIYSITIFLASNRLRILGFTLVLIASASVIGYQLFDVIALRIEAWINPWLDPSGRSYQIVQSLITVGAGGLLGTGPGLGSPGLVPVAHSDFIFAAIAEETGLAGSLGLLILIGALVQRGVTIALRSSTRYQRLLAGGLTTYLGLQSILIVGGNLRLLPLTGVTLPLISYGGSSLITSFAAVLLLFLISNESESEPAPIRHTRPYLLFLSGISIILLLLGMLVGWWSVIKADTLQGRTDNARRTISDRYVRRGAMLDRNNGILVETQGEPGSYRRYLAVPGLGPVVGYVHPVYGEAGLEMALDSYLRGLAGHPSSSIWTSHLFYGQPPPGINVRMTLDARLQNEANRLFGSRTGAAVIMNAQTGEVLAMTSFPNFDPNLLDERMPEWLNSNPGVLINRAAQSAYPLGSAVTPFLLASFLEVQSLPPLIDRIRVGVNDKDLACALQPPTMEWDSLFSNGCQAALSSLSTEISDVRTVVEPYSALRQAESFGFILPAAALTAAPEKENIHTNILGLAASASPLQVAVAAAALSYNGMLPSPNLVLAVQTSSAGWVTLAGREEPQTGFSQAGLKAATRMLARSGGPFWEVTAVARKSSQVVSWYLSGTLPEWQGVPLALVVILEADDPGAAREIGRALAEATLQPAEIR